ncbi:MAG: hypothetical protein AABW65_02220 [Nanoarchaeota archaeon]
MKIEKSEKELVSFMLRSGLVIVLLYAAISAYLNPTSWMGFTPQFISQIIPPKIFLYIHSTANIILAFWLLSNKNIFYASMISAILMLAIIVFNYSELDIIFRDISILFSSIALAILSKEKI